MRSGRGSQRPASAFRKDTDDDQGTEDHPRQDRAAGVGQARKLGNVSQACKNDGRTRATSFYRFKELYDAGGELALQELTRRKPILKNRTPPDVEAIIVELSLDRPAYGQIRIANEASQARPFDFARRSARGLAAP